jgi:hypothetical protein
MPIRGELTISQLAVKHGIHQTMIKAWSKQAVEGMAGRVHRSETGTPASCAFRIPMICSSVKRLRLIFWSSRWARTNFKLDYLRGATSPWSAP